MHEPEVLYPSFVSHWSLMVRMRAPRREKDKGTVHERAIWHLDPTGGAQTQILRRSPSLEAILTLSNHSFYLPAVVHRITGA